MQPLSRAKFDNTPPVESLATARDLRVAAVAPVQDTTLPEDPEGFAKEPAKLIYHRRAPQNLRHRLTTASIHLVGLVAADILALALAAAVYIGLRDYALLGAEVADFVRKLIPTGYMRVGEYGTALLIGLFVTGNYSYGDHRREPHRLLAGCALATGLAFWAILWSRGAPVVLFEYAVVTGVVWAALLGERVMFDLLLQRFAPRMLVAPRTLLVGSRRDCDGLHRSRVFGWERDYTYVGYAVAERRSTDGALGTVGELPTILDRLKVHWVVVASSISEEDFRAVMDAAGSAGCKVFAAPSWLVHGQFEPQVIWRRGHGLLELTPRAALPLADTLSHAPDSFYLHYGKRVFDIGGALFGVLLGAVPVLLGAIAMRLESRGPVFILQPRVGRGGRIFEIVKLRSMVADAERDGKAKWATMQDERITPVGRWIRRLRIDEFPQFVNVLLGQMSLVGPRPERPELHDEVVKVHPEFAMRVAVKPGITGLAQIYNGYADSIDSSLRKLAYDQRYLANISLGFDLMLLKKTVNVVLTGHGSR
ncbi:MAG: sugar transferase [Gemmatimonadetes bacterium]|nr:sugar transferase [Gemmatimonadota bacterium]